MDNQVDSKIVGQILSAIGMLSAFSDEKGIGEFITSLLSEIPGCESNCFCSSRLNYPIGDLNFDACQECLNNKPDDNQQYPCLISTQENIIAYSLESSSKLYGYILLKLTDIEIYMQYDPFVKNFGNAVAIALENRWQQSELLSYQKELEERVVLRTLELEKANTSLQEEVEKRIKSEESLKLKEALLNRSQEIAKLGSWHLDIKKNILSWSDVEYQIFGQTPESFESTYEAFLDAIHPDDREMVNQTYTHAIKEKIPYECIHRIIKPDGETRVVLEKSEDVLDDQGNTIHSYGFTQDITDQYFQNERYKNIIKTSIDGFWMINKQGRIIEVNDAYCRMSGFSFDEFAQMSVPDIEVKETPKQIEQRLKQFHIDKSGRFESQHRKKDGAVFDVEVSTTFSESEQCFVAFIRDITEQKRAEKDKAEMESRLKQAQKMEAIGTLAGGIAHDFNNILSAIIGYSEMAKSEVLAGTELKSDLDNVLTAANRAKDLVKQILAFSRQTQAERSLMKIQPLIKEGLRMLRSSIPTTISMEEDIDNKTGLILADPTQIQQVLMNLCTNAYHAMEDTGGTLSISLEASTISQPEAGILDITPGEYVKLSVSDTGTGIRPEVIENIFNPFFTTKETGKGTGMGLSIIHGIVTGYGGTIQVESQLGKGATFHVYFPVSVDEKEPLVSQPESEEILKGKERVLFVDDETMLADMGKTMLERIGYQVTVRNSSIEALTTFQNTPDEFDLVITDQTMPDMTGSELARRMMQIKPGIPIILCTGYSNLIDEHSAKAIGIREFALKPLTMDSISKLVRNVLDES